MPTAPRYFSTTARRSSDPPISWLMKIALERPGLVNLAAGFTDNDTLPVAEVRALAREVLRDTRSARAALQYGTTPGLPALRREIVRRVQRQDQAGQAGAEDVVVTNGSQQLLELVTQALCDPGDLVAVEDPTYFVYLGIIQALGVQTVGFDSTTALQHRLEQLRATRQLARLKLIYVVTYYQNPTGRTWSAEMKREFLDVVRHYQRLAGHPLYVLEDAGYRDLRIDGPDEPSMAAVASRGNQVIYSSTLSKPFATGLRLGYGMLPEPLRRSVLRAKGNQDFGSANFLQVLLARALAEGHYDRHLPVLARAYRRKRDAMLAALDRHFPASARYDKPRGGLFLWVELPARSRTGIRSRIFRRALDRGVIYVPGEMCYGDDPQRPVPRHAMRLSFGPASPARIERGIRLLAEALA